MALPEIISVEDLFSSPIRAGATISPDGTRIAYLAPWKNRLNVWVQSVDSDDEARRLTADDEPQRVHLPVDRRSALDAVHAGRRRRRELARVPARPGEPGCARRRSHAVPGGQGHVRATRRTSWEGDRSPQHQEDRTLRRVRNRHRHRRTHPDRREPRPCRLLALQPRRRPARQLVDTGRRHRAVPSGTRTPARCAPSWCSTAPTIR